MNKRKTFVSYLVFVVMLAVLSTQVMAGDPARTGTAAGEQLLVPVGARSLGMGGANLAYTSGVEAIYWNPAGLANMNNRAAGMFSTMQIFGDINVNYAAIGVDFEGLGTLGFSLKAFDIGDIPLTTAQDQDGLSGQTFAPTMVTVGITYAKRLTDAIGFGFTSKLVHEGVPRASATAFAFDAGIQYNQLGGINGLAFGVTVKNIGTNMEFTGSGLLVNGTSVGTNISGESLSEFVERPAASNQLPANIELGLGYNRPINEENQVVFSGIFDSRNFGNDIFKLGAEYQYNDLVFLRGGYNFLQKTEAEDELYRFTLGFGLHYAFGNSDLTFDYAYRDSQYFDGNNVFSLQLAF